MADDPDALPFPTDAPEPRRDVQVLPPDLTLTRMVKNGKGRTRADIVEVAEKVIEEASRNYAHKLDADIRAVRALADPFLTEGRWGMNGWDQFFIAMHDLKGNAGTFGQPLISRIADSLAQLLTHIEPDRREHADVRALVALHLDSLTLVAAHEISGHGLANGRALRQELAAGVERGLRRHGSAEWQTRNPPG